MIHAARNSLVSQQTISVFGCPGTGSAPALGTRTAAHRTMPAQLQPALCVAACTSRFTEVLQIWVFKARKRIVNEHSSFPLLNEAG